MLDVLTRVSKIWNVLGFHRFGGYGSNEGWYSCGHCAARSTTILQERPWTSYAAYRLHEELIVGKIKNVLLNKKWITCWKKKKKNLKLILNILNKHYLTNKLSKLTSRWTIVMSKEKEEPFSCSLLMLLQPTTIWLLGLTNIFKPIFLDKIMHSLPKMINLKHSHSNRPQIYQWETTQRTRQI